MGINGPAEVPDDDPCPGVGAGGVGAGGVDRSELS